MLEVAEIVIPVFGLIALGYAAGRFALMPEAAASGLSAFVFNFAIPALLFKTMLALDGSAGSPWRLWLAYFPAVAIVWACASMAARWLPGVGSQAAADAGITAGFGNIVLLGLSLAVSAFGARGAMTAALIVSVHAPLLWLAATLQSEWQAVTRGTRWRVVLRRMLLALVRNPIIVAIVGGSLWRMAGPPMPAAASQLLGMLGDAAIPTALFSLGLTLRSYGIRGNLLPAVVLSGLKLALLPMLVFALGAGAVGVDPGVLAVAVLVAASPTGVNAYIFAQRNGHAVGVVSTTIALGTLFSMLTLPLVLSLVIGLGQP